MLFAIDYDGTYTAAPDLWNAWIIAARRAGHSIAIVTMRHNTDAERIPFLNVEMVIYTGRKAKIRYCEMLDIRPDVWIDDDPHGLMHDRP